MNIAFLFLLVVACIVTPPSLAYAYIDPLEGGLFLHVITVSFILLMVSIYLFGNKIKSFFIHLLSQVKAKVSAKK